MGGGRALARLPRRASCRRRRQCARAALSLALALTAATLLAAPRPARAVDPHLDWRVLESEHFVVHFPDGGYDVALRTARYLEAAHDRVAPVLGHVPWKKTEVLLTDDVDDPNGSATYFPYPTIRAFMAPPASDSILNHYDDYLWLLLVHEYTHILHLDTVHGPLDAANRIFGHILAPNGLQPRWIIEGLATWQETVHSSGGRNRSALSDMYLRAQVLETGALWTLDETTGQPVAWPGGTFWYLYGGRFWDWLSERRGAAAALRVSHAYGGRTLPYAVNLVTEEATGVAFAEAFAGWRAEETARHAADLEAIRTAGVREGRRLTNLGRTVTSPRWTPDGGSLLLYAAPGTAWPGIRRLPLPPQPPQDPAEAPSEPPTNTASETPAHAPPEPPAGLAALEPVREIFSGGLFDVSSSGAIVYGAREVFFQEQTYGDLWALFPAGGAPARLSHGLRSRDPALSPAGDRLAFVSQRRGETALYLAALELTPGSDGAGPRARLGEPVRVYRLAGAQVDRPAFSPDGRQLAFTVFRPGGGRDLALIDLSGIALPLPAGRARPVPPDAPGVGLAQDTTVWITADRAQDADPAFDPAGRWLYFASDRSGVYDLYAQPLSGGRPSGALRRVTRTRTGAFQPRPSPKGDRLAYVTYGAEGYDLALLEGLRPEAWPEAEPYVDDRPPPQTPDLAEVYPVRAYSPWRTLRPWYWYPYAGTDGDGLALGAMTAGSDLVGRHAWSLAAWLGTASLQPGYDASWSWSGLYPTFTLSSARAFRSVRGGLVREGASLVYDEVSWRGSLAASLPLAEVARYQQVALAYTADLRDPRVVLAPFDPGEAVPTLPQRGVVTRLGLRYYGSSARGWAESVSPEQGVRLRLAADVASPWLGGDFAWFQTTGSAAGYLALPWAAGHVLAANLEGGAAWGDFGGRRFFHLGGLTIEDPLLALIEGGGFGGPVLRGYPPYSIAGDAYALANFEYRLPLVRPDRGLDTLPVFLRRVHAAAFTDLGVAGALPPSVGPEDLKVGVGIELRAEILLSYYQIVTLRLGLGQGLSEGGVLAPYLGLGGVF